MVQLWGGVQHGQNLCVCLYPCDRSCMVTMLLQGNLQTSVYDILLSTTAITRYAISLQKLSVCWHSSETYGITNFLWCWNSSKFETTQIAQNVLTSLHFSYDCSEHLARNKSNVVWVKMELFSFFNLGWVCLIFTCMHQHCPASSVSEFGQTLWRVLTGETRRGDSGRQVHGDQK